MSIFARFVELVRSEGYDDYADVIEAYGESFFKSMIFTYVTLYQDDGDVVEALINDGKKKKYEVNLSDEQKQKIRSLVNEYRNTSWTYSGYNILGSLF